MNAANRMKKETSNCVGTPRSINKEFNILLLYIFSYLSSLVPSTWRHITFRCISCTNVANNEAS